MEVPSRRANPFATCWVDPHKSPLCVVDEATLHVAIETLRRPGAAGAIVGRHGSGKTTVARRIAESLSAEGWRVYWSELHDGKRDEKGLVPASSTKMTNVLQVVDGYEQLGWLQRWHVRRRCRRAGVSLLVTSHEATSLRTLLRLEPDVDVALEVYRRLTAEISTPVIPEDVVVGFDACSGNLRELWFHLYDLHELRSSRKY